MALKRHRRSMRANPVELLVVNPSRPTHRSNPEWAKSLGRGMYSGSRYAAESARDMYRGVREAHAAHSARSAGVPTTNPGSSRPAQKRKSTVAKPKRDHSGRFIPKSKSKSKGKRRLKRRAGAAVSKAKAPARRRRRRVKAKAPKASRRRMIVIYANPNKKKKAARRVKRRRAVMANPAPKRRRKRRSVKANPLSRRFQKRAKRTVAVLKKFAKKAPKRSVRRRALSAQVRRAGTILTLARSRSAAKRIRPAIRGLQRAMLLKNPSLQGVLATAKAFVIPSAVAAASLGGMAWAGAKIANMLLMEEKEGVSTLKAEYVDKDNKLTPMAKYAPAAVTAGLSVVGLMIANSVAPKYRGVVFIGGMMGALLQAVLASDDPASRAVVKDATMLEQVRRSLALGEYTTVGSGIFHGVGEYTTVGSGIFHGLGEYTTVGGGADNSTEFAADSLRGLDDSSQFAAGEGGVLSGGIFKA